MRIQTGKASTILPTVESGVSFFLRSRQSPHHTSTKTASLPARVVGLASLVLVSTKAVSELVDGGLLISSGFSCSPEHATRAGGGMVAAGSCTGIPLGSSPNVPHQPLARMSFFE